MHNLINYSSVMSYCIIHIMPDMLAMFYGRTIIRS